MGSTTPKPTVLLIPGAWHLPNTFHKLLPALSARGFTRHIPITNPSAGTPPHDNIVADDAANVLKQLQPALDAGQDVIVVAHSYGGTVMSTALKDYEWTKEEGKGKVLAIVYMTSFALPEGQTVAEAMLGKEAVERGEVKPPVEATAEGLLPVPDPYLFYNDLPEAERNELASKLVPCPNNMGIVPGKGAPYKRLPTVYIKTKQDIILPVAVQERMIETLQEHIDHVVTLDSSHSPYLSMPEKVVDCLEDAEKLGKEKLAAWEGA